MSTGWLHIPFVFPPLTVLLRMRPPLSPFLAQSIPPLRGAAAFTGTPFLARCGGPSESVAPSASDSGWADRRCVCPFRFFSCCGCSPFIGTVGSGPACCVSPECPGASAACWSGCDGAGWLAPTVSRGKSGGCCDG